MDISGKGEIMLKEEIEQKAKVKVLSKISNLPQFTHPFFINNDSKSYTTKHNYYIIFYHFLNYVKEIKEIEDVLFITPYDLERLTISDVLEYKVKLQKIYSDSTAITKINSLKGIFKFLFNNKIIEKNIMSQLFIDNQKDEKVVVDKHEIDLLLNSISYIKDEFLRKRNLSIASLIVDTGLSVQDVVELNISNIVNGQIVYQNGGNLIQYLLNQKTNNYLNQYINVIDTQNINTPLYITIHNDRITNDAIQNIFRKHNKKITPSDFQAKPSVKIRGSRNYELIINPLNWEDVSM